MKTNGAKNQEEPVAKKNSTIAQYSTAPAAGQVREFTGAFATSYSPSGKMAPAYCLHVCTHGHIASCKR